MGWGLTQSRGSQLGVHEWVGSMNPSCEPNSVCACGCTSFWGKAVTFVGCSWGYKASRGENCWEHQGREELQHSGRSTPAFPGEETEAPMETCSEANLEASLWVQGFDALSSSVSQCCWRAPSSPGGWAQSSSLAPFPKVYLCTPGFVCKLCAKYRGWDTCVHARMHICRAWGTDFWSCG